jgi:nitroimidazol reductase NimA-like FMN-containing flavoprotein (pyridoxamine 5'-phosphate oxidase superfamily)
MMGKLTDKQVEAVLKKNVLGRIGCNDGEKTYVVPVNYVYHDNSIIAHSLEGMKIGMMRKNPAVCFEVDEMQNFTNWNSVILWGRYEELTDEQERYFAMKLFVDRMIRMKISETALPPEITENRVHPRSPGNIKPVIYRIVISEKTGRFENDVS